MFSLFRLRALPVSLLILSWTSLVLCAHERQLFTSSVTYCQPPETLLIQKFQVAYFPSNHSVSFNISAASVEPNVNVSANLYLNVYGMNPVNITLDLCSILHGALCPLPMYNFTGSDSIPLPSSISVANQIPGIAYVMPDIEAFAQLTLTQLGTGQVKACVQSTLSNGWSAHQHAVEWTTGAIALVAAVSALWQSVVFPDALAPFRLVELFFLYQSIVSSNFLSINYPSVYRSYGLNFAWSMGLFSSASSSIQHAVTNMRHLTGGHLDVRSSDTAVGFVNRKLSPYNYPGRLSTLLSSFSLWESSDITAPSNFSFSSLLSAPAEDFPSFANFSGIQQLSASTDVQTVTSASSNVLQAGLPIYVSSVHIATANTFTTTFIIGLILLAISLAFLGAGWLLLRVLGRNGRIVSERRRRVQTAWPWLAQAWLLRVAIICFAPVMIFALYQWTLDDSWLATLLAVLSFLAILAPMAYGSFLIIRFALRFGSPALFAHDEYYTKFGPLFAQFREERFQFYLAIFVAWFLKAVVIAAINGHGQTQIILWVIIEAFLLIATITLSPYHTRGGNILAIYLGVTRFMCAGLMIAFIEGLNVSPIPRVAIGVAIAVLWSIAVLVMFGSIILNLGVQRLWKRDGKSASPTLAASESSSVMEKGKASPPSPPSIPDSNTSTARPSNPTPEHNILLDPAVVQAYPSSPTNTSVYGSVPSSRQLAASSVGTSTLGSLLPGRWSLTPSSPPVSSPLSSNSVFSESPASTSQHSPQSDRSPPSPLLPPSSTSNTLHP